MTTIVSTVNNNNIAPILIEDPNDIRVNIFHNLKDAKATIRDGMFIAEGPEISVDQQLCCDAEVGQDGN